MFKQENQIWWYMLGVIVAIVVLILFARDYFIPYILGDRNIFQEQPFFYTSAPGTVIDSSQNYMAKFVTSEGTIVVDLLEKAAPVNVNSLVFLAGKDYYDGTRFHRLIPDFLLQGGDRNTLDDDINNDGRGGPGYFLSDEINWDNLNLSEAKRNELAGKGYSSTPGLESAHLERFSLAMASSLPNAIGSQFFFVIANPADPRLSQFDGYFTVVGKVVSGADVLDTISQIPVDDPASANPRPTKDITLLDLEVYTQ